MLEGQLRCGVIGLGVGAYQARSLYTHPQCELVWICDLDESRLLKVGSEMPEVRKTQYARNVLTDPNVDLVCVASYDEAHCSQVLTAFNHGKHVYVEKPMCLREDELRSIYKALQKHPRQRLSSNLVLRTCPLFVKVREAVQTQKMGNVYHLEGDYYWGRLEKMLFGWRSQANYYSIILGAAVHMVDLVL